MAMMMAFCLTACATKGECESCGQTETLTKFVHDDGRVEMLCDDCYRMYKFIYS